LYSKNGTRPIKSSGASNHNPEIGIKFKNLAEFKEQYINTEKNFDDKEGEPIYTKGFRITTSEEMDEKMKTAAQTQVESWYDVTGLTSGSCIDVCSDALSSVGLDPGYEMEVTGSGASAVKTKSPIPNRRYENIVKNNKGKDVSKELLPSPEKKSFFKSKAKEKKQEEIKKAGDKAGNIDVKR